MEQTKQRMPIYLGFSSQKGGVGKSTLAEIVSSILYYERGIELFVVDCDLRQDSFYNLRQREKACIAEDALLTSQMQTYFDRLAKPSYRILRAAPSEAIYKAEQELHKRVYQLVVFDFPGYAGSSELFELSLEMDYILSPLEADVQSMVSSLSYAKTIQDLGVSMSSARIKDLLLLWNKVDRRVRHNLIADYSQYILGEGLSLMSTYVYAAHRFSHELPQYGMRGVFRSTYLPPAKALRAGTGIDEFVEELLLKLKLQTTSTDAKY